MDNIKQKLKESVNITESAPADHIVDPARGSDNHMGTRFKPPNVLSNICSTNASMAVGLHEIAKSDHHLRIFI